ncbi:hypothetical protein [Actinomyces urogenitalis]|uniref:hypothetical protein n=1 Tax=Actinomyces urogenitalis TaxID=103621 RepID=UPI00242F9F5A|nr:hypothetical protein [Actinomyces urogenitalis]MCI7457604.1 hypothetical protein [Actinomyces urogenitalis]
MADSNVPEATTVLPPVAEETPKPKRALPRKAVAIGGALVLALGVAGGGFAWHSHSTKVAHDKALASCQAALNQAKKADASFAQALTDAQGLAKEAKDSADVTDEAKTALAGAKTAHLPTCEGDTKALDAATTALKGAAKDSGAALAALGKVTKPVDTALLEGATKALDAAVAAGQAEVDATNAAVAGSEGKAADDSVRTSAASAASALGEQVKKAGEVDRSDRGAVTAATKKVTDATSAATGARQAVESAQSQWEPAQAPAAPAATGGATRSAGTATGTRSGGTRTGGTSGGSRSGGTRSGGGASSGGGTSTGGSSGGGNAGGGWSWGGSSGICGEGDSSGNEATVHGC